MHQACKQGSVHFFYEGGAAGGILETPLKNCMIPSQLASFFHMAPLEAVIF